MRAASAATRAHSADPSLIDPKHAPRASGKHASGRVCKTPPSVVPSGPASTSAPSRSFQIFRSSALGAVPINPGWMSPAKRTPGMWRDDA